MGVHLPASIKGKKGVIINGAGDNNGGGFHIGSQNYTVWKNCSHDGSKLVYENEGKAIYGSSWTGLKEYSGTWDLIIDLAGNIKPASVANNFIKSGTSKTFKVLDKYVKKFTPAEIPSQTLCLDWNDMGIPPVEYDFWVQLWEMLPAKTVVACMGGHGRTGTCITALLIINGIDYETALETVRTEHCKKAVESMKQEEYLHGLYIEYLNRALALAVYENRDNDVADLKEDIKYAVDNKPTAVTTTASKHSANYGPFKAATYSVQPNEKDLTSIVINKVTYIKECTDDKCKIYDCTVEAHQRWIQPLDSLYQQKGVTV